MTPKIIYDNEILPKISRWGFLLMGGFLKGCLINIENIYIVYLQSIRYEVVFTKLAVLESPLMQCSEIWNTYVKMIFSKWAKISVVYN